MLGTKRLIQLCHRMRNVEVIAMLCFRFFIRDIERDRAKIATVSQKSLIKEMPLDVQLSHSSRRSVLQCLFFFLQKVHLLDSKDE